MRRHHHPKIPKFYTCYDYKSNIVIIQEYVPGITLRQKMNKNKILDETYALDLVKSLLETLEYIHGNGYVHRDIKPSNIMLTRQYNPITKKKCDQINLLDFGLCGFLEPENESDNTLLDKCGTVGYLAPELLGNRGRTVENSASENSEFSDPKKQPYDAKVDIFSLGIVFFEMLVGRNPFKHKDYDTTILRNYKGSINMSALFGYLDSQLLTFLKKLINPIPEKRYSVEQALEDPLISQLQFDENYQKTDNFENKLIRNCSQNIDQNLIEQNI